MRKVSYLNGRTEATGDGRRRGPALIVLAALATGTLLATTNEAEQTDSGWAIAAPTPFATGAKPVDLHQQTMLRHVLEQAQEPLLGKKSPTAVQAEPDVHRGSLRFAVRPESSDGWRAAGESSAAANAMATGAEPATREPILIAPSKVSSASNAAETDSSVAPGIQQDKSDVPARTGSPSLADAYGDEPGTTASGDPAVEETCQGDLSESFEIDADDEMVGAEETDDVESKKIELTEPESSDADEPQPAPQPARPKTNTPPVNKQSEKPAPKPIIVPPVDTPPPPLTKQLMNLRTRVRSVLTGYYRKPLNSRDHDPWEVMHGMLAYGVNSRIRQGGPRGELITSVGWLCYNKPCKGQTLLYVNPQGEVRAKYGVGLQGHLGQLLAMLAQCHVSSDYPIHVGKKEFTIHDLIEAEKKTCYPKSELTFKLIALQHYIDLEDKWVNDQGVEWDFPRLLREELAQPIRGAACGGTHRLSGLSLTVKARIRRGEPVDGEYARAAEFVKKYQQYAFRLQNRDGSLSTNWFRGAGDEDDINRRIKTTGHILEWLCYSLSDEEMRDQRTIRAVTYLANLMYSNYDNEWEVGPMSHATHALLLYDERVFRPFDKEGAVASYRPNPQMASGNQQNRR